MFIFTSKNVFQETDSKVCSKVFNSVGAMSIVLFLDEFDVIAKKQGGFLLLMIVIINNY